MIQAAKHLCLIGVISLIDLLLPAKLYAFGDGSVVVTGDSSLIDYVRDSLETNQAAFRRGRCTTTTNYQKTGSPVSYKLQQNIIWNGMNFRSTLALHDPEGEVLGIPINNSTTQYNNAFEILCIFPYIYTYNPITKICRKNRYTGGEQVKWYFYQLPQATWFGCCPPLIGSGKTWSDHIDYSTSNRSLIKSFEARKVGKDIEIIRHDQNGGEAKYLFDTTSHCNLREFTYHGNGDEATMKYSWIEMKDQSILNVMDFTRTRAGTSSTIENCRIAVTGMRFGDDVPISEISVPSFFANLKGTYRLEDNTLLINGRSKPSLREDSIQQSLDDFAELIRQKGYMKK